MVLAYSAGAAGLSDGQVDELRSRFYVAAPNADAEVTLRGTTLTVTLTVRAPRSEAVRLAVTSADAIVGERSAHVAVRPLRERS